MNLWFVRQQRYLFNPVLLFKTKINMTSHNCTVLKSHMTLVQMVVCIYPMTIGCRRWDKIIKNLKVYRKIINWKLCKFERSWQFRKYLCWPTCSLQSRDEALFLPLFTPVFLNIFFIITLHEETFPNIFSPIASINC